MTKLEKEAFVRRLGKRFRWGRKRRCLKSGRQSAGCICPACRFKAPDQKNTPCFETTCPRCGAPMVRLFPGN